MNNASSISALLLCLICVSTFSTLNAREEIKVSLPAAGTRTRDSGATSPEPLTGNVATTGRLKPATGYNFKPRTGYLPGLMKRTEPVRGRVSASVVKPDVYKQWLKKTDPDFALRIAGFSADSILVVKGQWDNSEKILDKFGFNYRIVSGREFSKSDLEKTRLVIVDCGGKLNQIGKQKLRQFVIKGGYLLSTDWDLDGFLSSSFKNHIVWNKGINRSLIYDANVVSACPVLFRNTVTCAPWKLDQESHLIRVMDPSRVRVLIESQRLRSDDPDKRGILACVFRFGRGYVLHMTGHFDNNSGIPIRHRLPDPAPIIKISLRQALATNFLAAALKGVPIAVR